MAARYATSREGSLNWEIDWTRRRRVGSNEQVWARNPTSMHRSARDWHWVSGSTLVKRGVAWQPRRERTGRHVLTSGYVVISLGALTPEEKALAAANDLWVGKWRSNGSTGIRGVREHQLVAAKKYGSLPRGAIVRHVNGDKADNRPENLLLGTARDNALDHKTAVLEMMYWRERALRAEGQDPARVLRFTGSQVETGAALRCVEALFAALEPSGAAEPVESP